MSQAENGLKEDELSHAIPVTAPHAGFAERLLQFGVRVIPSGRWYMNAAHTEEDVARTLEATDRVLKAFPVLNGA